MRIVYNVLGIMSGTSLDGVDLALCKFVYLNGDWSFSVTKSASYEYPKEWVERLSFAQNLNAYHFVKLHREYGVYIGKLVNKFVSREKVDFISSHGHTVFHEPENNVCFQIGCPMQIAATTNLKVVADFRTLDIALGGQGAPLVPIGDKLLFSEYDACVNLGGFANISFETNSLMYAFDICPVNIILNEIVNEAFNLAYDDKGMLGKKGMVNSSLLKELDEINFYSKMPPKSLGREWVEAIVKPILKKYEGIGYYDILATLYYHFANQIAKVLNDNEIEKVLFTGGGTFNTYLIELIQGMTKCELTIPSQEIIEFKEAIIFGFLGVLQQEDEVNCLKSVTGARKDNCGGSVTN